jgi:signal transduction histidine kinase
VFEEQGDTTVTAPLDRHLIEQVVANLLQNAVQAMPDGGRISYSVVGSPDYVEAAVSDTGIGIPEDVQGDVFRPFFTTRTRGTGLGLAVSRQIMDAHGGAISIESGPGAGTRVTLRFRRGE